MFEPAKEEDHSLWISTETIWTRARALCVSMREQRVERGRLMAGSVSGWRSEEEERTEDLEVEEDEPPVGSDRMRESLNTDEEDVVGGRERCALVERWRPFRRGRPLSSERKASCSTQRAFQHASAQHGFTPETWMTYNDRVASYRV